MSKETGGPAFPSEQHETKNGDWNQSYCSGMTLRDYFAAKALPGILSSWPTGSPANATGVAMVSYEIADAMLKVRGLE